MPVFLVCDACLDERHEECAGSDLCACLQCRPADANEEVDE
jgi:hypothetical protein